MGPGRPLSPSLPGVPAEPGGPCREEVGWRKPARKHGPTPALAEKPTAHSAWLWLLCLIMAHSHSWARKLCGRKQWGGGGEGCVRLSRTPLPFFHPLLQTLLQRGEGPGKSR